MLYWIGRRVGLSICPVMNAQVFREPKIISLIRGSFRPLTYLAAPYSYKHRDPAVAKKVRQLRFEACTRAAGWCITQFAWNVFSPITHSHPLQVLSPILLGDWSFWQKIDTEFLQISQRIVVLTIPGWHNSIGVTAELKIAKQLGLELFYVHPRNGSFILTVDPIPLFEHKPDSDL